ncbi:hypothetical protein F3Y22_tig00112217pilonHSYRG00168 [Hibiscus syriacus]|uniref:Uncharacterized protein n=1 Tax=Hibiscus syriacus TaxID=106335 RepID=A0A6A2Y895_HIBSY|nr:hypothetical protein F3Y22_tig00112217pilonHSYRG00168 [Hibiscus syriacus]
MPPNQQPPHSPLLHHPPPKLFSRPQTNTSARIPQHPHRKRPLRSTFPHNATVCDTSKPFRHLISLHLRLLPTFPHLHSSQVSSLSSLSFTNCRASPVRFPSDLSLSLTSFLHSLPPPPHRRLAVAFPTWGDSHRVWRLDIVENVSLASNSFSGSIPDSMSAIPGLVHVDLSNNQLNGTVPKFFSELKGLKVLNLENNELHGVLPFNASFIKRLDHGLPVSPLPSKESSRDNDSASDYDDDTGSADDTSEKKKHHHGPNKVVLGVAIGLSSIVFIVVFLVLLSKWCG